MYGGTEVDRALCVMTAILYRMRCWTGSRWRDFNSVSLILARMIKFFACRVGIAKYNV